MNTEDVMEHLFNDRVSELPHDALAEVFDCLIWCIADNGGEICTVREKWLEGDVFGKCAIALAMNETFPFETLSEMRAVFASIVLKWPQLKNRCEELIERRVGQNV